MVNIKLIQETMNMLQRNAGHIRRNLNVGDYVFNAIDTAEQKATNGKSWIDYWKQMTGKDLPACCPFCGQPLSIDDAEGCHIVFPQGMELLFGMVKDKAWRPKYIIPGHHKCNCQYGSLVEIKFPVETCLAIPRI